MEYKNNDNMYYRNSFMVYEQSNYLYLNWKITITEPFVRYKNIIKIIKQTSKETQ